MFRWFSGVQVFKCSGVQFSLKKNYPKLDTRISVCSFVRSSRSGYPPWILKCPATTTTALSRSGYPPGFFNGVDWRALVED